MSSLFYLLLLLPATTICGSSKKFLDLFPADYDRRTAPPLINEGKNKTTFNTKNTAAQKVFLITLQYFAQCMKIRKKSHFSTVFKITLK